MLGIAARDPILSQERPMKPVRLFASSLHRVLPATLIIRILYSKRITTPSRHEHTLIGETHNRPCSLVVAARRARPELEPGEEVDFEAPAPQATMPEAGRLLDRSGSPMSPPLPRRLRREGEVDCGLRAACSSRHGWGGRRHLQQEAHWQQSLRRLRHD